MRETLSRALCQHHKQHEVNEHYNDKTPGNIDNPFAVSSKPREGSMLWTIVRSDSSHSYPQAQGSDAF
jgi:hypothetical protein